ncbi:hypothetical protein [Spirillospora sp. CA-128828]|uniref:hypothetical protein n=1 Tax=Spirillospora sp. CA-128828 TaxID=3240033 RepID=UPI003D931104
MTGIDLDIAQIGPALIGYRLEVTDEKGYRVGIRLAHYEIITDHEGDLYILYSDPAHVAVRARSGATVHVAAATAPSQAPAPPPAAPPAAAPVAAPAAAAVPPSGRPYATSTGARGPAPGTGTASTPSPAVPPPPSTQARKRN